MAVSDTFLLMFLSLFQNSIMIATKKSFYKSCPFQKLTVITIIKLTRPVEKGFVHK
jgi:hypothetical protein